MVLTRLDTILEIDEANLTALVEPGVITQTLHEAVEARGLFYLKNPPDPDREVRRSAPSAGTWPRTPAGCAG